MWTDIILRWTKDIHYIHRWCSGLQQYLAIVYWLVELYLSNRKHLKTTRSLTRSTGSSIYQPESAVVNQMVVWYSSTLVFWTYHIQQFSIYYCCYHSVMWPHSHLYFLQRLDSVVTYSNNNITIVYSTVPLCCSTILYKYRIYYWTLFS